MRKRLLSILLVLTMVISLMPTVTIFASADGATADTSWFDAEAYESTTSYVLHDTADLEGLASIVNGGKTFEGKIITLADDFDGSVALTTPIGPNCYNTFNGTFDGNGKNVVLAINSSENDVGLFGHVAGNGTVKNVSTSGIVNSTAGEIALGGVVGYCDLGTVINCSSTATITCTGSLSNAGGVVGWCSEGIVINCYSTGNVSCAVAGGVVGWNDTGTVTNCYATGNIVSNSNSNYAGGICGQIDHGGTVEYSYGTQTTLIGGGDGDDCCRIDSDKKVGAKTLVDALNEYATGTYGVDYGCVKWNVSESYNDGYPYLVAVDISWFDVTKTEYVIHDTAGLEGLASLVSLKGGKMFSDCIIRLADDFDGTVPFATPIGYDEVQFQGTFDGNGKNIVLAINSSTDDVGLFGYVGSTGTVKNVSTSGSVIGRQSVGGIVGNGRGTIANCYSTATVNATSNCAGGIVGYMPSGSIANCYATGTVTSNSKASGIAGANGSCTVTNCYSKQSPLLGNGTGTNCYTIDEDMMVGAEGAKQPLVTALNSYVAANSTMGYIKWSVYNGVNGGYPYLVNWDTSWFDPAETEYVLCDTADLEGLAYIVNNNIATGGTTDAETYGFYGKTIKLADDFDGSVALITPISDLSKPFKGVFDGNNKEIKLNMNYSAEYVGLFSNVEETTIKNTITSGKVHGINSSAGIVANATKVTFENCSSSAEINCNSISDGGAGGIVGRISLGLDEDCGYIYINNCSFTGKIKGGVNTGGIVGNIQNGRGSADEKYESGVEITDCYFTGEINAMGETAGGIVGLAFPTGGDIIVNNCHATGDISCACKVGGILGKYDNNSFSGSCNIANCYFDGNINGIEHSIGGIAGCSDGNYISITNCYVTGNVSVTAIESVNSVGGIAGTSATVTNCYVTGNVSVTGAESVNSVGGVVGSGAATNCYFTGNVSVTGAESSTCIGGVVGGGAANNCYYIENANYKGVGVLEGTPTDEEGKTATLTAAQMTAATGEDNALVDKLNNYLMTNSTPKAKLWKIEEGVNNGYPTFTNVASVDFGGDVGVKEYATLQEAVNAAVDGVSSITDAKTVKLIADAEGNVTVGANKYVILDLNGKVLKGTGRGSVITNNGTLTVKDSDPTATHTDGNLPVGGCITGGNAAQGGGIFNNYENTVLKIEGGSIYNCKATKDNGAESGNGGGVFNAGKSFTMTGGSIQNCSADCGGGGVYNEYYTSVFYFNGGTIKNCTSSTNGGGIYNEGTTEINGGKVNNCLATGHGSGIWNSCILKMTAGEIKDCVAPNDGSIWHFGSAVYNNANPLMITEESYTTTFDMSGGTISGCKAVFAGAILNEGKCVVKLSGTAKIENNTADDSGGAIYNHIDGVIVLSGTAEITGNKSGGCGAGIYNEGACSITVGNNAKITGNKQGSGASEKNSNVYLQSGNTIGIGTGVMAPESNMSIGITNATAPTNGNPVSVTSNGAEADVSKFTSDNLTYKVQYVEATGAQGAQDYVAAHLALVNYTVTKLTNITNGIILEKSDMTSEQAKAVAIDKNATPAENDTFVFASTATAGTYKYVRYGASDWGTEQTGTLAQIKALSGNIFVIGTVTNKKELTITAGTDSVVIVDWTDGTPDISSFVSAMNGETPVTTGVTYNYTWYSANADVSTYTPLQEAPTKVGVYQVVISVKADNENYTGKSSAIKVKIMPTIVKDDGEGGHTVADDSTTYTLGGSGTVTFSSVAELSDFVKVTVSKDGAAANDLTENTEYTVNRGSIEVTLKNEYLESLEAGEYKFSIISKLPGGEGNETVSANYTVTVEKKSNSGGFIYNLIKMIFRAETAEFFSIATFIAVLLKRMTRLFS